MTLLIAKSSLLNRETTTLPPGPRGLRGTLKAHADFLGGDQVTFFRKMAKEYGDVAHFRLGNFENFAFHHPDAIEEILMKKGSSLIKDAVTRDLDALLGQGLLTSEGQFWRRQRKLAAPALQRRQIASYAEKMVAHTRRAIERWPADEAVEFHRYMMGLTLDIVVDTLFNLTLDEEVDEVGEAIDLAMEWFHQMAHTLWRFVPQQIPTPMRRRFAGAVERLDAVIYELIRARRASGEEGDDLLWRLIVAADDEGNQMTDAQLRDEVITMFIAGHETTALAITYAWHLLTQHPVEASKVYDEVDRVLGDRDATMQDVPKLEYLNAVVKEAMRLYPPAWIIGREAVEDIEVAGWEIPKGAQLLMPQCVIHRDARWFEEPDAFQPQRWLDGLEKRLPRFAYFPFGGGARVCIGNHFAMMEAVLVVATLAQHLELRNVSTEALRVEPAVTLRPVTPVMMEAVGRRR